MWEGFFYGMEFAGWGRYMTDSPLLRLAARIAKRHGFTKAGWIYVCSLSGQDLSFRLRPYRRGMYGDEWSELVKNLSASDLDRLRDLVFELEFQAVQRLAAALRRTLEAKFPSFPITRLSGVGARGGRRRRPVGYDGAAVEKEFARAIFRGRPPEGVKIFTRFPLAARISYRDLTCNICFVPAFAGAPAHYVLVPHKHI